MISDYNVNPDYCSVIKRCLPPLGEYGSAFEELHPHHDRVCVCSGAQSCQTLCDTMNCSPPGSFVHGNSPGKNTGVGCHTLLQGIFSTQRLNTGLPHCRWIIYHLSHQRSARYPQVSFIFGLSILFHLSIYLFLSQYHTVLMTVAL